MSVSLEQKIKKIARAINKKYHPQGDGFVVQTEDSAKCAKNMVFSSGSISLDYALGIGGYRKGRNYEIYGQEGSGKTTIALHAIAEAQKFNKERGEDKAVLFVDAEHALDLTYAESIGVDINPYRLVVCSPDYGEQALETVLNFLKQDVINMFVVDSVAALVPKAEFDGSMEDQQMGEQARLMGKGMRKITGLMRKNDVAGIWINQVREKVGVVYGNPETTPGGRALKFFTSVRMAVNSKKPSDSADKEIKSIMKVSIPKNKLAPPYRVAELDVVFGKGFDSFKDIVNFSVERGIIQKNGSWYSYEDEQLGQGVDNTKLLLKDNPELLEKIKNEAYALLNKECFGISSEEGVGEEILQKEEDVNAEEMGKIDSIVEEIEEIEEIEELI